MAAGKKTTGKKKAGKSGKAGKPAPKKSGGKKKVATAPKKSPAKPVAAKAPAAPAKPAASPVPPAALAPAPSPKPPAPRPVAPMKPLPSTPPRPAARPGGGAAAADVNLGHILALRPRAHAGFKPEAFQEAKRLLANETYATIEEAARAVAEKAVELSNKSGPTPFPKL